MAKNEKDKKTTAHITQHRKLKNKQHELHHKFLTCYIKSVKIEIKV